MICVFPWAQHHTNSLWANYSKKEREKESVKNSAQDVSAFFSMFFMQQLFEITIFLPSSNQRFSAIIQCPMWNLSSPGRNSTTTQDKPNENRNLCKKAKNNAQTIVMLNGYFCSTFNMFYNRHWNAWILVERAQKHSCTHTRTHCKDIGDNVPVRWHTIVHVG